MLQLATDLIADKSHYTIRSHGKKVRSREESQASLPPRDHEKFALFQRTNEGFVFTSKARGKDDLVEQDIPKTVVIPVASTPNPPTLKEVNSKLRNFRSTAPKKQTAGGTCLFNSLSVFSSARIFYVIQQLTSLWHAPKNK